MTETQKPNYDLLWLRKFLGLTQQEAANAIKVNRVTYARWESGKAPTPPEARIKLAEAFAVDVSTLPDNAEELVKREEESDRFVLEVQKMKEAPGRLRVDAVAFSYGLEDSPLAMQPVVIPIHLFRPSTMKHFNVPEGRWVEFVKEKPGECVADLRDAGYSWDQAVEWIDGEAKAKAYTLFSIWDEAKRTHFSHRLQIAKAEKIAMPTLQYAEIVRIFDALLDAAGWGLV